MIATRKSRQWPFDLGVLAGAALFVFGLWQIYRPLGSIAGGLLICVAFWFAGYGRGDEA